MRHLRTLLMIATLASTSYAFAADSASCDAIANACKAAGYSDNVSGSKRFWQDCMLPVLLGKTVEGVTLDAAQAKECRTDKITEMKKTLKDLQQVK